MRKTVSTLIVLLSLVSMMAAQSRYAKTRPATPPATATTERLPRNSWRGITPLQSGSIDVARALGLEPAATESGMDGPFRVEGGEVTFSYLTPSLAKIYRAPAQMVGKVFTIYFRPGDAVSRADLKLASDFRRCAEDMDKTFYYFVSDAGLAYQLLRNSDRVETIIYQPTRAQVRRLAVNTGCIF
jgi:hypothetical protein